MRQSKFAGQSLQSPPLSSLTILDTINFLRHTRFPPQKFSALWDKKISTENLDTRPPPFLIHKLFHKRKFSETEQRRVALRNNTELSDKTILMEKRDNSPLSYPIHFSIPKVFWNKEGFPDKNFRHCETKKIWRELFIVSPPLFFINFFASGISLEHSTEGFLYEMFCYCENEQVRRKIVITAPSLIPYIFRGRKFSETQKVSSTKFFVTVRQKFFDAKKW